MITLIFLAKNRLCVGGFWWKYTTIRILKKVFLQDIISLQYVIKTERNAIGYNIGMPELYIKMVKRVVRNDEYL
jgi:hypothetical protein